MVPAAGVLLIMTSRAAATRKRLCCRLGLTGFGSVFLVGAAARDERCDQRTNVNGWRT